MNHILERAKEPSSWGGLGAIILGLGQVLQWNEAQPIADAVSGAADVTLATGDPIIGLAALLAGVVAIFRRG